ncbi:MAG: ribulose-phosphate 3-epimerase [Deltaproteobacteria bacterium]|jgi:ribulose-phosphate 3-epimerase|nr:ribulose-phosphate 3-epimerase [Deltaproteobacteria bacterium]
METLKIAPSILSADIANLSAEVESVKTADYLHVDIMDGHFVPNLTYGPGIVKVLKRISSLPLDVHLMIDNPAAFAQVFIESGADILTVHAEVEPHLHRLVHQIKDLGAKAGVSLNPSTPVSVLESILPDLDLVLIMTVNPGFGGQKFIPSMLYKLKKLRTLVDSLQPEDRPVIEVDGGIKIDNIKIVAQAGVDMVVSGSGIFKTPDRAQTINLMQNSRLH